MAISFHLRSSILATVTDRKPSSPAARAPRRPARRARRGLPPGLRCGALWLVILALGPSGALASGHCNELVGGYSGGRLGSLARLALEHDEGGALLYLGAVHSLDPRHPQLAGIERAFEAFAPTLALYEGHQTAIAGDREATVREHGEAGLVRHLAAELGVPAERLEPPEAHEVGELASRFGPERVELFFLLREAARLRERRGLGRDELETAIAELLATRSLPGLTASITDLDGLDKAFWRHWPYPRRWWEARRSWFDPFLSSGASGGVFTNEIARTSAELRDRHMVRLLTRTVLDGERVFAVVGRDHLAVQAPALRCALEQPPG